MQNIFMLPDAITPLGRALKARKVCTLVLLKPFLQLPDQRVAEGSWSRLDLSAVVVSTHAGRAQVWEGCPATVGS